MRLPTVCRGMRRNDRSNRDSDQAHIILERLLVNRLLRGR